MNELNMKSLLSSETSISAYQYTHCYNPGAQHRHLTRTYLIAKVRKLSHTNKYIGNKIVGMKQYVFVSGGNLKYELISIPNPLF
jgi:hypothetical protein